jgi:hypothetical protein
MRKPNNYTNEELTIIVSEEPSIRRVLKRLNLSYSGSNYKQIHRKIKELNLNIDHFNGQGYMAGRPTLSCRKPIPLDQLFIEQCNHQRHIVKRMIFKLGLLPNRCAICGLEPKWNNKSLVMVLDHINGINNDNRLNNLRLICPNCNSQTDTFTSRNICNKRKSLIIS